MSYSNRIKKEQSYQNCAANVPQNFKIASTNSKTGLSINMPLKTCKPSVVCERNCYACRGPIMFKNSIIKSLRVAAFFDNTNATDAAMRVSKEFVNEKFIRWNGSGDLTEKTVEVINSIDKPQHVFSRIPELLNKVNNNVVRILSIDEETLDKINKLNDSSIKTAYLFDEKSNEEILVQNIDKIDLIFLTRPDLITKIPQEFRNKLCKCDAGLRPHALSCMVCFDEKSGCWAKKEV